MSVEVSVQMLIEEPDATAATDELATRLAEADSA